MGYVILQLFVPLECAKVTLELGVSDTMPVSGTSRLITSKRRLFFSTVIREAKTTPLHAAIPIDSVLPRGEVCIRSFRSDLNFKHEDLIR
jgi:hypothetical protein